MVACFFDGGLAATNFLNNYFVVVYLYFYFIADLESGLQQVFSVYPYFRDWVLYGAPASFVDC